MRIRDITETDALNIATDHITKKMSRADCLRKHFPQYVDGKKATLHTATHRLFKNPLIVRAIVKVQAQFTETIITSIDLTAQGQALKLEAAYTKGMEIGQIGSAVQAIDKQNKLGKLYDGQVDDTPDYYERDFGENPNVTPIKTADTDA